MAKRRKSGKGRSICRPLIRGSMQFPLEYHGDNLADFLRVARYTGLFSHLKGANLVYSKPRWYRASIMLYTADGEYIGVMQQEYDTPLDQKQLGDLVWEYGNLDLSECTEAGIEYDIYKSYILIELTERNNKWPNPKLAK